LSVAPDLHGHGNVSRRHLNALARTAAQSGIHTARSRSRRDETGSSPELRPA
jgi:hypothetical protein